MNIINEDRILEVEKKALPYKGAVAGTTISRVLLDHSLFEENDLDLEKASNRGASLVWCLGLGTVMEPKALFYGHTIEEAVEKAEKVFDEQT